MASRKPRIIPYRPLALLILTSLFTGCAGGKLPAGETGERGLGNGWEAESVLALEYARNFRVDYFAGGYKLITLSEGSRFLVVPEGSQAPGGIDGDIRILRQPLGNIYLAATSAMGLFDALESLDRISLSGTDRDGWYIENARKAMDEGRILFAGKYSKPDYELILARECALAIESTMINHTPETREKLEELGVPVLVEQSSSEKHPLGRTEWIKLYGALLNREELAEQLFRRQAEYLESLSDLENTGKGVAFFYISSSGSAIVRKSGDYVTKMIELAGGRYIFRDLGDPEKATSTLAMEMEAFYAAARDADFIIYNSTIDGGVSTLAELVEKNGLLADFRAVKEGNVWCTDRNLYQETTQLGLMIRDIHEMLISGEEPEDMNFIFRLR